MIVSGHQIGNWVAKRVKGRYHDADSWAIGLARDGEIVAGVMFENWNGVSVTCHIAAEGRLTREFLWAISDYAFNQCRVRKVIGLVASGNAAAIRMDTHFGFVEEGRIKDAHPDGDLIIYTLTRSACRFLGEKYRGQRQFATATD